jgi:hypothetical protein
MFMMANINDNENEYRDYRDYRDNQRLVTRNQRALRLAVRLAKKEAKRPKTEPCPGAPMKPPMNHHLRLSKGEMDQSHFDSPKRGKKARWALCEDFGKDFGDVVRNLIEAYDEVREEDSDTDFGANKAPDRHLGAWLIKLVTV